MTTAVAKAERFFPTPRATDGEKGGPNQKFSDGKPGLAAVAAMFPTPLACDYRIGYGETEAGLKRMDRSKGSPLRDIVAPGGQLNPEWVEWLSSIMEKNESVGS